MKTIEFNDGERQVLLQLIDIAVKTSGLGVAEAAAVLAKKIGDRQTEGDYEVDSNPKASEVDPSSISPPTEDFETED